MPGNVETLLSTTGGVQSGSIGLVFCVGAELGGELGDDAVSRSGSRQPLLSVRTKISIAEITGYFIFTLLIADSIIACGQN